MNEIWKPIAGYEGCYEVSNLGRVRSLERYVPSKCGSCRIVRASDVKQRLSNKGYFRVYLCVSQVRKWKYVHRLVAEAFIPNPNNYPCVNHKDENPKNNCVDNLEWCTYSYNRNYGTLPERLYKARKGQKHSDETKRKMSETRRGRKLSEYHKQRIREGLAARKLMRQREQNII